MPVNGWEKREKCLKTVDLSGIIASKNVVNPLVEHYHEMNWNDFAPIVEAVTKQVEHYHEMNWNVFGL